MSGAGLRFDNETYPPPEKKDPKTGCIHRWEELWGLMTGFQGWFCPKCRKYG